MFQNCLRSRLSNISNPQAISNIEGHAKKSIENLRKGIEESKSKSFQKVLYGLGIRYVGESASKTILKQIKSIDELISLDIESLSSIDEIGDKTSSSIVDFFKNNENLSIVNRLKLSGLNFTKDILSPNSSSLANLIFVISGVFEIHSREELKKIIEQNGGKISSSISSKTNYLVAGKNVGPSKFNKANELEVSVINEVSLIDLIS